MSATETVQAMLVQLEGSVPREVGTKMTISATGQAGTIGGGELEFRVVEAARTMLGQAQAKPVLLDFPLGPELGQCCGGYVRVLLEPVTRQMLENPKTCWRTDLQTGAKTKLESAPADGKIRVLDTDETPILKIGPLAACRFVEEHPRPKPVPLYIFGAGHVGAELASIVTGLDFELHWFDSRQDYARAAKWSADPVTEIAKAPRNARFVVLTHSHDLDYALCREILSRSELAYCGLIGSNTKRARFVAKFRKDQLDAAQISRLTCPAGLAGIGGKAPREIAIAIAGQLLVQTRGSQDGN
jgi:xanthine dehydrogenase accessory factor